MMILRREEEEEEERRRRTDHKTPECVHTVWETHVAPGIVRGANGYNLIQLMFAMLRIPACLCVVL